MESDDLAAIFGDAVAFDHLDSKYSEVMFQQVAALLQRVRAEAVADERQRIVHAIEGMQLNSADGSSQEYDDGLRTALEVAAGSVPVATPESQPTAMGPCAHYWANGPHTYTNTAQWPNVVGHCPGPAATPKRTT